MFYVARGNIPHKRHTQHRGADGSLYAEELFGVEGFTGRSSCSITSRRRRAPIGSNPPAWLRRSKKRTTACITTG